MADDTWIQTFTGTKFFPLKPRAKDVDIRDIAHALAMKCRFAGHTNWFYCPTQEQRILSDDLQWVRAGDLKKGDGLLAFDEVPIEMGSAGKLRRRFRHGQVTHTIPVKRNVIRLEMEDGSTVRSSEEHPWLVATKISRNQTWLTAAEIRDALKMGRVRFLHRFFTPWRTPIGFDAGWLSGMADGEGCFSIKNKGCQLGIAQRPGPVHDRICKLLEIFGFKIRVHSTGNRDTLAVYVKGGWREIARFLGELRPIRLLNKFKDVLQAGDFTKQMDGKGPPLRIVKAFDEGEEWVTGLETSRRTYICEGFGAHNSVAQHSVVVSRMTKTLEGLLHDAGEAYLPDVVRPIKRLMPVLVEAEKDIMRCVAEKFGLQLPMPENVKLADNVALATEARDLMGNYGFKDVERWDSLKGIEPMHNVIDPWHWAKAEKMFLDRFEDLGGMII